MAALIALMLIIIGVFVFIMLPPFWGAILVVAIIVGVIAVVSQSGGG